MSNPFELRITLRQHTPIIHFQHHQDGATLRASEVKPKLDRFIFEKYKLLFPEQNGEYTALTHFDPSDKSPSVYKMRVTAYDEPKSYLLTSYMSEGQKKLLRDNKIPFLDGVPYFAQEKEIGGLFEKSKELDRNNRPIVRFIQENLPQVSKFGLINNDKIEIIIEAFNDKVRKIIAKALPYFFAYENFGTRQSKGFGCYSIVKIEYLKKLIAIEEPYQILPKLFPVVYQGATLNGLQAQFNQIQNDYKLLKSGRGAKEIGGYHKSLLFLYGVQLRQPIRWEKRYLKQKINATPFTNFDRTPINLKVENENSTIYNTNGNQSWNDPNPPFQYEYLRAMLGLAEQFEFLTFSNGIKYVVEVKSTSGIERFQSPIRFKIYNNTVYLVAENVLPEMLSGITDNTFNFNLRIKENNKLSGKRDFNEENFASLNTPQQFDIVDFMRFALETSNERINGYKNLKTI
jgi:hypothetical protein